MNNESVFDELRALRQARRKQRAELEKKLGKIPDLPVHVIGPNHVIKPNDNTGYLIIEERRKAGDELEDSDREIALWYFAQDYRLATRNAADFLGVSQKKDIDKETRIEYINNALKLHRRARKSLTQAMAISAGEKVFTYEDPHCIYLSFDRATEQLNDLKDRIYIIWEFPDNNLKLIPLHFGLKYAVKIEDYEAAARMRDEINSLLPRDWKTEDSQIDDNVPYNFNSWLKNLPDFGDEKAA